MSQAIITISQSRTSWRAFAILMLGVIGAATSPILIRFAQGEGVPSLAIAAGRLILATLILSPITLHYYAGQVRRFTRRDLLLAGAAGVWLAICFIAYTSSLAYTSVLINNVLDGTSPLWIALLEVFLLKTHLKPLTWVGLALAVLGGFVIALAGSSGALLGSNPLLGGVLAVGGAIAFSVYIIIGRKSREKKPLLPYIWLVFSCAAAVATIITLLAGVSFTGYSIQGYFWVLMITLIPQLVTHSAFNYAVKYISASFMSIIGQLSVVLAVVFSIFLLQEIPGPVQIAGGAIILAGVSLATLGHRHS